VGATGHVGVHGLEAEEERDADGEAGGVGGRGEAAEGEGGAVDAGGEGGVVAGVEGGDGVGEEGGDHGEADVAVLQAAAEIDFAQRQRVLADQELDNGRVVVESSAMKGRVLLAVGDGQQAPLPRVELGFRDHQLDEFQWRPGATGDHDGSDAMVLVEDTGVEE